MARLPRFLILFLGVGVLSAGMASAHEAVSPASSTADSAIDPAAVGAVTAVDAFSAAIKANKLAVAADLLDPQVLILESGGAEHGRDEYMSGHAIEDAAFMRDATVQVNHRGAHAEGEFAWVATESTLHAVDKGKPLALSSTETMLLRRTAQGWKIIHIHWSSRRAPS